MKKQLYLVWRNFLLQEKKNCFLVDIFGAILHYLVTIIEAFSKMMELQNNLKKKNIQTVYSPFIFISFTLIRLQCDCKISDSPLCLCVCMRSCTSMCVCVCTCVRVFVLVGVLYT
jgi:hypothetical protein